jgi:hypothetical protein
VLGVSAIAGAALVAAALIAVVTGGWANFAGVPSDRFMQRLAARTWWASPALVVVACGAGASAWDSPLAVAASIASGLVAAILFWSWRPARSGTLSTPALIAKVRTALDRDLVTDPGRWRRTVVMLAVGLPQFVAALLVNGGA